MLVSLVDAAVLDTARECFLPSGKVRILTHTKNLQIMNSIILRWWGAGAPLWMSLLYLVPLQLDAQHSFKFETQVRDRTGQPVPFAEGVFRVSILEGRVEGVPVFVELHRRKADDCGTVTLEVGAGQLRWGILDEVDWSKQCYLVVEHGPGADGPFELLHVSEISAVPVALYAASAGSVAVASGGCAPFGVCVLSMGAVGDGQTDDTGAFFDAISLASKGGQRVLVPAGVYRITQTLVLPDGVTLVGEGVGADPLGTPYNGSLLRYEGSGPAVRIEGHQAGLRELAIADAHTGALQADGVVVLADSRLVESVRLDQVLLTNFTGGAALRLEAKNGGGIAYCSFYDLRVRHARLGIHVVQDHTSFVNSNSFYHGAISGGGFENGILIDGGNNNVFYGMVVEPPATQKGHLVVRAGEIQGYEMRIEGTAQQAGDPLIWFFPGTAYSVVGGTYSGGSTWDEGANFLDFHSGKNMDPTPETANLLENASFHGFSNGVLPYWEITGSGVQVEVLPPELSQTHRVLKLTVPSGVVCQLKPASLFVPALMDRPEYRWINFGAYVRTGAGNAVYTRYNAPGGVTTSTPHPGDGRWHFIGMTAQTGTTPDPRLEIDNTTGASLEVYISMPTLNFGQARPAPAARPLTTAGGILTGTVAQGVVEVAPAGPFVVLPHDGNIFIINGTPTISRINHLLADRFPRGTVIVLVFNDAGASVTNNPYIALKSGFTSTTNATLTLLSNGDGTWREIDRNL